MKIVINACYGGFSLSPLATKLLAEKQGKKCYFFIENKQRQLVPWKYWDKEKHILWFAFDSENVPEKKETATSLDENFENWWREHEISNRPEKRDDPNLVKVVEELGEKADGRCAHLKIVEIPDGVDWIIEEYDGMEHIAEVHRTWA